MEADEAVIVEIGAAEEQDGVEGSEVVEDSGASAEVVRAGEERAEAGEHERTRT